MVFCEIVLIFLPRYKDIIYILFVISFTTVFIPMVFYFLSRKFYGKNVFRGMFSNDFKISFIFPAIFMILGTILINFGLSFILPRAKSSHYLEFMEMISSDKSILLLFMIPIVILAPIGEELVFRGIILRGLSSRHKAFTAIFLSSLLFALSHLNLDQIPNAFVLGFVFSILVIHSNNLLYSIFYHFINNLMVTSILFFSNVEDISSSSEPNLNLSNTENLVISVLLILFGIALINIGLKITIKYITSENRKIIPSQKIYNNYLKSFKKNKNLKE